MNDNQFWIAFCRIVAAALVCIVVTVAGFGWQCTQIAAQMVKDGADPLKVKCLMGGDNNYTTAICIAAGVQK